MATWWPPGGGVGLKVAIGCPTVDLNPGAKPGFWKPGWGCWGRLAEVWRGIPGGPVGWGFSVGWSDLQLPVSLASSKSKRWSRRRATILFMAWLQEWCFMCCSSYYNSFARFWLTLNSIVPGQLIQAVSENELLLMQNKSHAKYLIASFGIRSEMYAVKWLNSHPPT